MDALDARVYWNAYTERCGGLPKTAEKLQLPYSTIAGISNGSRGISPKLALRMAGADPLLDPSRLVWVRPLAKREKTSEAA